MSKDLAITSDRDEDYATNLLTSRAMKGVEPKARWRTWDRTTECNSDTAAVAIMGS